MWDMIRNNLRTIYPFFLEASMWGVEIHTPGEISKNGENPDRRPTILVPDRDGRQGVRLQFGGNAVAQRFLFVILREGSDRRICLFCFQLEGDPSQSLH